jgi:hypothetical protein
MKHWNPYSLQKVQGARSIPAVVQDQWVSTDEAVIEVGK